MVCQSKRLTIGGRVVSNGNTDIDFGCWCLVLLPHKTSHPKFERHRSGDIVDGVRHYHHRPTVGVDTMKNNWFSWNTIVIANIIMIVLGVMML